MKPFFASTVLAVALLASPLIYAQPAESTSADTGDEVAAQATETAAEPKATQDSTDQPSSIADDSVFPPAEKPEQKAVTDDVQPPAPTKEQKLIQKFHEIQKKLATTQKTAKSLKEKIATSTGIDKISLEIRQFDYAVEILKLLSQLTDNIAEQMQAGMDTSEYINDIRPMMMALGPQIRKFIGNTEADFSAIKAELEDNTTDYILAFSKHLNYVDTALTGLYNHVNNLNTLSLNNQHSTAYMESELLRRAELLTGQLQLLSQTRDTLRHKLQQNDTDQDTIDDLNFNEEQSQLVLTSLRHTTKLMSKAGLDSTAYQTSMIESTGHISSEILNLAVLKKLIYKKVENIKNTLKTDGIEFIFRAFLFTAIVFGFWLLSLLTRVILRLSFERKSSSHLMKHMMMELISRSILVIGFLVALSQLGVSLLPVLTGLGIAGFIIGFALQDTLGNFASGMMILIYRPYDVGDMVEVGKVFGRVSSMNLVSTTIMTIDNQTLIIPNNKIWGDVITNVTDQKTRRVDMTFNLPLDSDIDEALSFFQQLLKKHDTVLDNPEPLIELNAIHNHALEFIVKPWVNTEDYWPTYWAINASFKRQIDEHKIKLPVQQHQVVIQQSS